MTETRDRVETHEGQADVPGEVPESTVNVAPQWKLVWWKFRKHKLAMGGAIVTIAIYMVALFAEFLAPFPAAAFNSTYPYAPPQPLKFFERNEEGLRFQPHVNGYISEINPDTFARTFTVNPDVSYPVTLFAEGASYELFGLFETNIHLIGPEDPTAPMYLLGADDQGRDLLSRVIFGTRISMTIGLIGVTLSLVFGVLLGGISGYFSGPVDNVIQRIIEFLIAIPTLPLWLALAASLPPEWTALQVYFAITVILSLVGWTTLARVVRGRFLSLREEDFVMAAQLDGTGRMRTIRRHMIPSFLSHIIASVTLAVPGMILAETALSFLGLGLRPPVVSWGVLLQAAQNVRAIATAPWLLLVPGTAVVVAVLALNYLGDGIRDSADPYA